jgi:hypothetical protein
VFRAGGCRGRSRGIRSGTRGEGGGGCDGGSFRRGRTRWTGRRECGGGRVGCVELDGSVRTLCGGSGLPVGRWRGRDRGQ